MKIKYNKEQQELLNKTNPILWKLESEYKTYDAIVKFLLSTRDDFDTEKIKKGKIKRGELKRLLDVLPNDITQEIQFGTQFSLGLTYNHIYCNYDPIKKYLLNYIKA